MRSRRVIIALFVLLLSGAGQHQTLWAQSKVWYFGEGLGIDFHHDPPRVISGPISTDEGCAVVTEPAGRVLFSTDGKRIYDGHGQKQTAELKGSFSSTHAALIVPHPANPCSHFLVFTVGSADTLSFLDGLHVYDVRVHQGQVVVEGDRQLIGASTEKLAATPDGEGGFWLVAHDYDTSGSSTPASTTGGLFYAYHITNNSSIYNLEAVLSYTGHYHRGKSPWSGHYWNTIGQMKFNRQGNMLGLVIYEERMAELFSFNRRTGKLNSLISLAGFQQVYPRLPLYGFEFSPDGRQIFISSGFTPAGALARLWAFDISILHHNTIWEGRRELAVAQATDSLKYPFGGLQLGPDGKIYLARRGRHWISSIESNPQLARVNFIDSALYFPEICQLSFPTAITTFNCLDGTDYCSRLELDLGADRSICSDDSLLIGTPAVRGSHYRWNTGDSTASIYGKVGQVYVLSVIDSLGCQRYDSIRIHPPSSLSELVLPGDTSFCRTQQAFLHYDAAYIEVRWDDGPANEDYLVQGEGPVKLQLSNGCDSLEHLLDVSLKNCECEPWLANAFTPNGDGINDYFSVESTCELEYYELIIFDRWGKQLFEARRPDQGWNGLLGGQPLAQGVYLYKLRYKARYDEEKYRQGHISLLR